MVQLRVGAEFHASRRPQCLRDCPVTQFNSPCPQIFCQHSEIEPLRNFAFDADISGRVIELPGDWEKLLVTAPHPVTRAVLPHGRPTRKSTAPARSRELRVAQSERSRFADGIPADRNHVEERTRVMYTNCRNRFWFICTGDRESRRMVPWIPVLKVKTVVPEMKARIQTEVSRVIGGIPIHDFVGAGKRYLASRVPHLEKPAGSREVAKVYMVGAGPLRFERGTRRRKQPLPSGYGVGNIQLGVQGINRRIFKNRRYRKIRKNADVSVEPQPLIRCRLKHILLRGLIFTGSIFSLAKCGKGLSILMFLAQHSSFGQQILIGGFISVRITDCVEFDVSLSCLTECKVSVCQANAH